MAAEIVLSTNGQISEPREVGPGARITVTGSGWLEWTPSSLVDVRNGVAQWQTWPKGQAAGFADTLRRVVVRARATGAMQVDIDESRKDAGPDGSFWQDDFLAVSTGGGTSTLDVAASAPTIPEVAASGYGVTSSGGGGVFHSRAARGTQEVPTAVQSADFLGGYGAKGWNGTDFTVSSSAAIHFVADENFTPTANGSSIRFLTTPVGSPVGGRLIRQAILANGRHIFGGTYGPGTVLAQISAAPSMLEVLHNRGVEEGVSLIDTRAFAQGVGGVLAFGGFRDATTTAKYAQIVGFKENASSGVTTGGLSFFTNDGTNPTSMREVLRFASTGNCILGNGDLVAAPSSQTLRSPNASGTDIAGGSLTIAGGRGTGAGAGGTVSFQTAPQGGSGSSLNTAVERVRIKQGGQVRFVPLAAAPTLNVEDGDVYYNSTTNRLQVRAAGAWVDL